MSAGHGEVVRWGCPDVSIGRGERGSGTAGRGGDRGATCWKGAFRWVRTAPARSRFGARGSFVGPQKARIRHIQRAPGVVIASVARMRLLVVVMGQVKQTCASRRTGRPDSGQPWTVRRRHPRAPDGPQPQGYDLHRQRGVGRTGTAPQRPGPCGSVAKATASVPSARTGGEARNASRRSRYPWAQGPLPLRAGPERLGTSAPGRLSARPAAAWAPGAHATALAARNTLGSCLTP